MLYTTKTQTIAKISRLHNAPCRIAAGLCDITNRRALIAAGFPFRDHCGKSAKPFASNAPKRTPCDPCGRRVCLLLRAEVLSEHSVPWNDSDCGQQEYSSGC